ncbi:hypothetical protein [Escherichia coli]|uniref:hypothetical protein n=1 Tax=Escherichia coli TaxID=562 RepID=UPI00217FE94F|nr:hypothetical protein [Escherichia coli]MCS7449415.1 hypothetical protein [Escherichia coli]MDZ8413907.1 hypothetical protein [Escherichia coli]MDZ9113165.1 hypothetical protein [Escherichia coli]MDZ9298642.1 hypothetical protein [Escherichia coli]MEC4216475.1 hypothetical protein [Escherichia coli]
MESNIKGLVAAGHEMASELKAECGAVDMRSVAKLISDLATQLEVQLEVQLVRANALAAENAGLKSGAMDEIKVINRGGQAYCVKDGVQVNPIYARGWNDYRAKSMQSDTPATDAFLAEVRAKAFDDLCAAFVKHASVSGLDDGDCVTVKEATDALLHCAEQLHKGVHS